MLKISLIGKPYSFYTFTEILGFIQGLKSSIQQEAVAEQAIELLKKSSLEFDLVEYYTAQFNSFIPKKEEYESQQMVLPNWYCNLWGFCL
jgi:hypothetical protein